MGVLRQLFGRNRGDRDQGGEGQQANATDFGSNSRRAATVRGGTQLENAGITVPVASFTRAGVSSRALTTALQAYDVAWKKKQTKSFIFTVVDFSKSDDEERLWVLNLETGQVLFSEFVAHGYGSDGPGYSNTPDRFSNTNGSGMSSLGLMRAGKKRESYAGPRRGTDVREFHGLEKGFNDNVHSRNVIMHAGISGSSGNQYVSERGVSGASAGCWALDPKVNAKVIAAIPPGSLIFNYYPDRQYLENSSYLKQGNN